MRILLVNDYLEKVGGVEIYDHKITDLLEKRGNKVRFVGGGSKKSPSLITFFSNFYNFNWKKKIEKEISNFKPDVMFAHSVGNNLSPSVLSSSKKYGVPIVLKIPYLKQYSLPTGIFDNPLKILSWTKKSIHREILKKHVDLFIASSKKTKRWLENDLKVPNVILLRNPIFWDLRKKKNFKNKKKKIMYSGRLEKEKGLEYLIRAVHMLRCDANFTCNFSVEIFGKGSLEKHLKRIVKKKRIKDIVNFHGYVPNNKLKNKYLEADALALPSTIPENCPLSILEAMSQATPVITTCIGGQKELVKEGETGFLVNSKDQADLAKKIKKLLKDKNRLKKMQQNCLDFARKHSPKKHVGNLEKLFYTLSESDQR